MGFTKIENADLLNIGVIGLPDQPGLSTAAMQAKFEETSRSVVIPKHNGLIDELEDVTAADYIGATPPTGRTGTTVKTVMDSISGDLATLETEAIKDAFQSVKVGTSTLSPSGADTIELAAGANVTLGVDTTNNVVTISSTGGGGGGGGDMYVADYDNSGTVKSSGGIASYVSGAISGKADASSLATVATSGSYNDLSNQPTIPTALSQLSDDATHRVVTDVEKTYWNAKLTNGYSNIDVTSGGTTTNIQALNSDKITFKAGANVTLAANSTTKEITISSSGGGGGGGGDMYEADYDNAGRVKSAGGIDSYVTSAISGKQDQIVAGSNITIAADGKTISATDTTYSPASTSANGLMSSTDKLKLDGIASGAEVNVQSDWNQANASADDYIKNKPSIPAAQIQSDWNQTTATALDYIKNKPTIPDPANDATLTVQRNGVTVGTFTADADTNTGVNIVTDEWLGGGTPTTVTVSSGSFTFTGLDDTHGFGYEPWFDVGSSSTEKNPSATISTIVGDGTASMSVTYTTDADNGTTVKLRIFK